MVKIQKHKPVRTCSKQLTNYKAYKPDLINDFHHRCGYCDSHDKFFGGPKNFQIDHFRPHSIAAFSPLKHVYSNLVYSCQSCNRAKSNKWSENDGFVDPCSAVYDDLIFRDAHGKILHSGTVQSQYIHTNLLLSLRRHEILWCIEKFEIQKAEIQALKKQEKFKGNILKLLLDLENIQNKIDQYNEFLYLEISN